MVSFKTVQITPELELVTGSGNETVGQKESPIWKSCDHRILWCPKKKALFLPPWSLCSPYCASCNHLYTFQILIHIEIALFIIMGQTIHQ